MCGLLLLCGNWFVCGGCRGGVVVYCVMGELCLLLFVCLLMMRFVMVYFELIEGGCVCGVICYCIVVVLIDVGFCYCWFC